MKEALDIQVKGIVQGVGFRPFVYRLAQRYLIDGWVLNDVNGVFIHAEGDQELLDQFVIELSENAPSAAEVKEIEMNEVPLTGIEGFEIRFSDQDAQEETTLVSPDLATCEECLHEALEDPANRRYGYPFINCTNCGPRFTIIDRLPYDRANTSMNGFTMCDRCSAEYHDPADRRFHAQPDACFTCGPSLTWRDDREATRSPVIEMAHGPEETAAFIERAAQLLVDGGILATKDLGGFHLICDASQIEAVTELRQRKHRDGKPFAVMMRNVEQIERWCAVNAAETRLLSGPQRPIVLLRKLQGIPFYPGVADRLVEVGVMLPATALQAMLLERFAALKGDDAPVLIMTSGNVHDEPICMSDEEAYEKLHGIADAFLGNDRPILSRFDDSVARVIATGENADAVQFVRRARGYAPAPIELEAPTCAETNTKSDPLCLFATGPEQKNTFTLLRGTDAFVSQHIGDVENADTYDAWLQAKDRYEMLFEARPTALACDLHPEYLTSKWAHEQQLPLTTVQHHHAHIVSVMVEHHLHDAVCGIAFDGTGYGYDGAIWGGEVLLANERTFERFANFAYVPMPGGAACIKHPLRMAYGVLWAFDLLEHPGATSLLERLANQAAICETMIEQGINTPMTSSVGRLFDAASALLGICEEASYEGEPAILLEAAATSCSNEEGPRPEIALVKNSATDTSTALDTSVVLLDAAPVFEALLDAIAAGIDPAISARRFHEAFADAMLTAALLVRELYGIDTVALSGGVFMNRLLIELVLPRLENAGLTVAINRDLPPNDGCISLGQAVVAWAESSL